MVLDGKSVQEYPVNAGLPQGSTLCPTLFLIHINDLPDNVIYNGLFQKKIQTEGVGDIEFPRVNKEILCGNFRCYLKKT